MIKTTAKGNIQKVENSLMNTILCRYLVEGNAIGLWRLPDSTKKNLIICTEGVSRVDEVVIEEIGTGFVFSPFDGERKKLFLRANVTFSFDNGEITSDCEAEEQGKLEAKSNGSIKPNFYLSNKEKQQQLNRDEYITLIEESINQIESGRLEKLVPSRSKEIQLPSDFDAISTFNALCILYPNAFISLVSTPDSGTWIGASPELLVSVDANMKFKTVAVAGTQTMAPDDELKMVAWTQKEIEEQALVSRYIINCFKKIRLREFEEHGPKSFKAGNLVHLKTEYEVDMAATNFPQLGSVMLKLLHPTSAVCGMPREESIDFLHKNENLERSFYSGFLGPVNFQGETHLFVNLRCMKWNHHVGTLFAGAGVTRDSNPKKEWDETELKMDTLLKVIRP